MSIAKFLLQLTLAFANVSTMNLADGQPKPTETEVRIIGSAFTDTLLNVSLRGLDDTQVLGTKLVAELLKRGLQIVPTQPVRTPFDAACPDPLPPALELRA